MIEKTKIIGRNQQSILDLVLTSDESSIFDKNHSASLGKYDHSVITFQYNYMTNNQNTCRNARIDFFRT